MDPRTRIRRLKVVVFVACLVPLAKVATELVLSRLGANPIAELLNRLGFWALALLLVSLAVTPLRLAFGWTAPLQLRRMLGLFAFFYATAHVATYVVVDQGLDFGEILEDIEKRKFITVGFLAWLTLIPLAVTSTNGWVKRLGGKRWQALHRLAYVSAALGLVHHVWRFKVLETTPVVFIAVAAVLAAVRIVARVRRLAKAGGNDRGDRPAPELR